MRGKISATAENILQVRKHYPDSSLADLHDTTLMPKDLRDAHKKTTQQFLRLTALTKTGLNRKFSPHLSIFTKNLLKNEKKKKDAPLGSFCV